MKPLTMKSVVLAACAICVALTAAGVAYAASNHAISGTVYSGCDGTWYNSTNERVKAGTGPIKAEFSYINDGGLTFRLLTPGGSQIGSQQSWTWSQTGIWKTFTSSYGDGKDFYNSFRDTDESCPAWGQSDYNFDGTENY
ncbi:MAG TPA: hypothetical protein VJP41_00595 [Gaiellaceae bacterium]|nr:hypothetical protein [Acidimicrobiales bacterium]HKU55499.1 hypothetical protein [Gaiellaceae bacterium]